MTDTIVYKLLEACREPGCPVCRLEQQGVERYLDNHLYENVNSPHLRRVLGHIKHRATGEKVLAIHRAKFERLREELAEFIRKNDYQAIAEGFGQEGDAWLRAIATITGSQKKM